MVVPPRVTKRTLTLGTKKPRRVSITALEGLIKRLREVLVAVAKDMGEADALDSIELVDFKAGSSQLAFEQPQRDDRPSVLDTSFAALRARAKSLPLPPILTARSIGAVDNFAVHCGTMALAGIPVRIESDPSVANDIDAGPVQFSVPVAALPSEAIEREEDTSPTGDQAQEKERPASAVEPEWAARFSGTIHRLAKFDSKMWVMVDEPAKLIQAELTPEQFAEADADKARWKHVVVLARTSQPDPEHIEEVLELEPSGDFVPLAFEPLTVGAESVENVIVRLRSFLLLPKAWDSYSARPISQPAISAAISFLASTANQLAKKGIVLLPPFAAPLSTGAVQLEWEHGDRFLELEFQDKKKIRCLRGAGQIEIDCLLSRSEAYEFVRWLHSSEKL